MRQAVTTRRLALGRRVAIAVMTVAAGLTVPVIGIATGAGATGYTACSGGAAASGSVLQGGQQLTNGQCLISTNGQYQLVLSPNDAIDLLNATGALLWTATNAPAQGGVLAMQSDGNLVLYSTTNQALWSSNTTGLGGTTAILQDDGNFVIYTPAGAPVWSTNTSQTSTSVGCVGTPNTSTSSENSPYAAVPANKGAVPGSNVLAPANQSSTLQAGQALCAGGFVALMQPDGNLVLYSAGEPIWATYTGGHPGAAASLYNGVLTVGSWSTNPNNSGNLCTGGTSQLLLSNTGDLSIVCFGPTGDSSYLNTFQDTIWSAGTAGGGYTLLLSASCPSNILQCSSTLKSPDGAYQLTMQSDGNLVDEFVANGNHFPVWDSGTGTPGSVAVMQNDGNFVIYPPNSSGSASGSGSLFATGTTTTDPILSLDNNGNLSIWGTNAGGNYSVWSSHSTSILGATLVAGQALQPGQALLSLGGQYRLSMGTNGAAELTETNQVSGTPDSCPIWTAPNLAIGSANGFSPPAQPSSYLELTTAGALELLPQGGGSPLWSATNSFGVAVTGGTQLVLQSDGNLVLTNSQGNTVWYSNTQYTAQTPLWCTGMELGSTGVGSPTQAQVAGGNILLAMQSDCNLVAYGNAPDLGYSGVTWSSGTDEGDNPAAGTVQGGPYYGCYAIMQGDGNVVVYAPNYPGGQKILWSSGTNQSSTPPGAPPVPGPYVAVIGYTGGQCPANSSDSNDKNKCVNYTGYTVNLNASSNPCLSTGTCVPSVAFSVGTYDGIVLGSPDVLNTPSESAGTALGQAYTAFGYLGNVLGGYGFPSVLSLGQAAWGIFSIGGLAFGNDCGTGSSCPQANGSGQPSPPQVVNLSTCGASSPASMAVGSNLNSGGCLESPNDEYQLIMQPDGNLVLYYQQGSTGYPLWASNTSGNPGAHAYLQQNGPLFVYSTSGAALYSTPGAAGAMQAFLTMQNDGNLVLYANNVAAGNGVYNVPYAAWSTQTSDNRGPTLASGEVLNPGQSLVNSSNGANGTGAYSMTMQTNGVLTLSQPNVVNGTTESSGCPLWTEPPINNVGPPTSYNGSALQGAFLQMQTDGNLVLYGPGPNPKTVWQSGTSGNPGAYLVLGTNGQLSIYGSAGSLLWTNYTNVYRGGVLCSGATLQGINQQTLTGYPAGTGSPQVSSYSSNDYLVMQGDCNLVLYINNEVTGGQIAAWQSGTAQSSNVANDASSPYNGCYATQQSDGNFVVYAPNFYGANQSKALWASGFTNPSAGEGVPSSAGPYALEFAPASGGYVATTYDTVTGAQEWYSGYNVKVNDTDYDTNGASPILEKLGSWIHTFLGVIVFIAGL